MHPLAKTIFAILGAILLAYIFSSVASFLQISFERYINYLLFTMALIIFYVCLPKKRGEAFE
jgi:hypothetical protein